MHWVPARTVMRTSHLGNNRYLLFNYVANMVTYPYPKAETVYLKVTMGYGQFISLRCPSIIMILMMTMSVE